MLQLRKILVPRDYSKGSDTAFLYALRLAEHSDAQIETLFVEVLHGPSAPRSFDDDIGGQLAARHVVDHAVLRDAAPAPAILHFASTNDVDMIVMGTHGRRGLSRLFLGSVAEEVVRLSPCPVLTVHAEANTKEPVIREILVPIDFSMHSRAALRQALTLAREFNATLDLLHVVEEPLHPPFYEVGAGSIYDAQPDIEVRVEKHLRQLYSEVADGVEARFHVRPGHAAREIASFAAENGSSLIVTSTHGLTGIEHLLIGSVAERVTRMAPCPVLTVKPVRS
jgi:nucleotide-binding universal stress UspA family protein